MDAGLPGWSQLLESLFERAMEHVTDEAKKRELESARADPKLDGDPLLKATLLEDVVGSWWREAVVQVLDEKQPEPTETDHALAALEACCCITTNYDRLLEQALQQRLGKRPQVVTPDDTQALANLQLHAVLKLHGDIDQGDFVFSRRDYRRRLYETPSYMTFLRAVFSTRTVLYMGFSFTDEYLNEVRSEVLSMLGHRSTERPIAYALVADVSPEIARYYAHHEGIEIIPFDTRGGTDFSGFDDFLQRLYERTNPRHLLGKLLAGRRLLWLDPNPPNNVFGERLLGEAAVEAGGECPIHRVDTWEEALARLGEQRFDLVITHWGHEAARDQKLSGSVAEKLLDEMHARRLRVPVVVFAAYAFADENKARALRAGAVAYTFSWSRLFQTIADIFRPGTETG